MDLLWILFDIIAIVLLLILVTAYICYRITFFSSKRNSRDNASIEIPSGGIYAPFHSLLEDWAKEVFPLSHRAVTIRSFDGLTLHGKYYEISPGAPIELLFHGYRGSSKRDMNGGVLRCFKLGRNALVVDQRACGNSDGHIITFGVYEHRDCLSWVDFIIKQFGTNVQIILTGVSMGAATVLTAADKPLPPNVIGIIADCGYTSAKEIILKVIRQMKLPAKLLYPFVKLGARIYGHFRLEETSPIKAMQHCSVPVIFFHGENDDYVPCEMSRINYEACNARKMLVTIPNVGHGLCYPAAPEIYLNALQDFFNNDN